MLTPILNINIQGDKQARTQEFLKGGGSNLDCWGIFRIS